ncbi:MAG: riboflavin synthase [Candidatus Omnitrophica bacterium]|nr:riboflavin synthase [Candidatus Omnitrophota bacterium]
MFTGIIQTIGTIDAISQNGSVTDLSIRVKNDFTAGLALGDSIAINGTCLTVVRFDEDSFSVQIVDATKKTTTLGKLSKGAVVNLEKALAANGRLDGHFVQGHVDGVGVVKAIDKRTKAIWLTIAVDKGLMQYMIDKGSVAIDGISLTIQEIEGAIFSVAIIPHTFAVTNLSTKKVGDIINIETDLLGKYVISYLSKAKGNKESLTVDKLRENGF